jgi:hypothetical protein
MHKLWILAALWASVAVAQDVDIYVSDAGNFDRPPWKILRYDGNGDNPEVFINQQLAWPQDILFLENQGVVLISNLNSGRITRYNARTGAVLEDFATGIGGPTRMKIGRDGLIYVLQWTGDGRVLRFRQDGAALGAFTSVGVPQSIGLDWDAQGNLYVSSYSQGLVRRFDANGADLGVFIGSNLAGPTNIWFDATSDLLVSDYDGGSIKRFSSSGAFEGVFIGGLGQSEGIGSLPNGNLLVGNGATGAVKMYQPNGTFIRDLVSSGAGGLIRPNAVVVRAKEVAGNHTALWWNPNESGWGINVVHQGNTLFATLFTYDASGNPLWLVMTNGDKQTSGEVFSGALYRTTGPAFNANPFTPIGPGNVTAVGTMTFTFSGQTGTLTYTNNGVSVTKAIQKQVYGSRAANCTATSADRSSLTNYQDLWWNAAESGWGVNVTHQDNTLFAALFTYSASGQDMWWVMSGGVRQTDGSYLGELYQTTGPAFNANPFTPIGPSNVTQVGTMRFTFGSGTNGTLTYTVNGISVTKAITRQVYATTFPACS